MNVPPVEKLRPNFFSRTRIWFCLDFLFLIETRNLNICKKVQIRLGGQ